MNNVMMNAQPLRSSPALRKNLSFKANEAPKQKEKTESEGLQENEYPAKTVKTRKFSTFNALKKFGEGVISPFKSIIDGGVGSIMMAIAGAAATNSVLNTQIGKKVKPFLVATLGIFGASKIAHGVNNVVKNKENPERQENSFVEIGQGSMATSLALLSAKSTLKAADPTTDVKNPVNALWQCGKRSGEFLKEAFSLAKEAAKTTGKAAGKATKAAGKAATTAATVGGGSDVIETAKNPNPSTTVDNAIDSNSTIDAAVIQSTKGLNGGDKLLKQIDSMNVRKDEE